ncbi:MAG: lipase / esterase [Mycobacterium sp.]|nr:lipase / esterase [Mycobacterium sp.]
MLFGKLCADLDVPRGTTLCSATRGVIAGYDPISYGVPSPGHLRCRLEHLVTLGVELLPHHRQTPTKVTASYYLVPELAAIADGFPKLDLGDLASTRDFFRQAAAHRPVHDPNRTLSVTDVEIPGCRGEPDMAGRVYAPAEARQAVPGLIHLFGGGYVAGSIDMIDYASRLLADQAGIAVVAIAYRLAPENPYPAALNDAYAALEWITSSAAIELGIDTSRIGVLGESAGGGLAASLVLVAGDRNAPRLTAQFLDAPTVDDRIDTSNENSHVPPLDTRPAFGGVTSHTCVILLTENSHTRLGALVGAFVSPRHDHGLAWLVAADGSVSGR